MLVRTAPNSWQPPHTHHSEDRFPRIARRFAATSTGPDRCRNACGCSQCKDRRDPLRVLPKIFPQRCCETPPPCRAAACSPAGPTRRQAYWGCLGACLTSAASTLRSNKPEGVMRKPWLRTVSRFLGPLRTWRMRSQAWSIGESRLLRSPKAKRHWLSACESSSIGY